MSRDMREAMQRVLSAQAAMLLDLMNCVEYTHDNGIVSVRVVRSGGEMLPQAVDWQRIANEWADCACNGVQWIKNVRDFPAMAADALAEMMANVERIRSIQTEMLVGSQKKGSPND